MAMTSTRWLTLAAPLLSAALLGCNQPPTEPTVSITPTDVYTGDIITVNYDGATDKNKNDLIEYRISWSRDGERVASLSDTDQVVPRETTKGEEWTAAVTAWDGKVLGNPVSASVTVLNTPAEVTATLTPEEPDTTERLRVDVDKSDADGDPVSVTYQWVLNGSPQADTGDSLLPVRTEKGQVWEVRVIANDGEEESEPVVLSVTIANTPPSVKTATIDNPFPDKSESLKCIGGGWEDLDDDPEGYDVEWLVNGASTSTDAELAVSDMSRGDRVRCKLTPNDGEDVGPAVSSDEVVVQNTAPSVTSVEIGPEDPLKDDVVTATIEGAFDPDGDEVTFIYEWEVNGSVAGETARLASSRFRKGDRIRLTLIPTDGIDDGEQIRSNIITAGNNKPSIDLLSIDPTTLYTDTIIESDVIAFDPDADDVTFIYEWSVNGSSITAATSDLDGSTWFDKGDTVQLKVTPTDGEDNGDSETTAVLTVLNSPPTGAEPVLDPEEPSAGEDTVCTLDEVATDADGDTLTYTFRWEVNGSGVTGATTTTYTGDTLPGSKISDGDTVVCYVQAYDGTEYGPEVATAFGTESNPGVDCADILDKRPDYESGAYWIDPDEDGDPSDAIEVFCDMETDGGGWTLAYYVDAEHFDGYYGNSSTKGTTAPNKVNADKDIWDIPSDLDHTETLFACTTTSGGPGTSGTNWWRYNSTTPYSNYNASVINRYITASSTKASGTTATCYADYDGASTGSYGFFVLESTSCGSCRNILWGNYHYRSGRTQCNSTSTTAGTHTSKWRSVSIGYPVCNRTQTKAGSFWIGVR